MSDAPTIPPSVPGGPPLDYAPRPAPTKVSSAMAIWSLVLAILGFVVACFPLGLVGLVLGIVALVRAGREPHRYGGKGIAIGGIILGGIGVLLVPLMISILLPSLSRARELAKRAVDNANLQGVGQSCLIYANDNRGAFPANLQVLIDSGMLVPKQLINPSSGSVPPACDCYFVVGLTDADPGDWIIAYSDPQFHNWEGANILYLDGRVEFVEEPRFTEEIDRFLAEFEEDRGAAPEVIGPK